MKKVKFLIVAMLLLVLTGIASSQYLTSSISSTQDTVLVNGSTDAGSRWFTNTNDYAKIFIEVNNVVYWRSYELAYPTKMLGSLRAYIEGADTTLMVQSDQGSAYIGIPVIYKANLQQQYIDCGGTGDGADVFTITAKALIRFRGIKKANL